MKAGINRKRYISITLSVLIVLIVLIIPYMLYFSTFSFLLETKADLGQLGDFIGGITNPLLSFLSIILLIYNINIQIKYSELQRGFINSEKKNTEETLLLQKMQLEIDEIRQLIQINSGLILEFELREDFAIENIKSFVVGQSDKNIEMYIVTIRSINKMLKVLKEKHPSSQIYSYYDELHSKRIEQLLLLGIEV